MMIIQSNTNVNTENKTKKLCIFDKERNEMWRASYINKGVLENGPAQTQWRKNLFFLFTHG